MIIVKLKEGLGDVEVLGVMCRMWNIDELANSELVNSRLGRRLPGAVEYRMDAVRILVY